MLSRHIYQSHLDKPDRERRGGRKKKNGAGRCVNYCCSVYSAVAAQFDRSRLTTIANWSQSRKRKLYKHLFGPPRTDNNQHPFLSLSHSKTATSSLWSLSTWLNPLFVRINRLAPSFVNFKKPPNFRDFLLLKKFFFHKYFLLENVFSLLPHIRLRLLYQARGYRVLRGPRYTTVQRLA